MHMLTGEASRIVGLAIDDHSATRVDGAHFSCDGVMIDFYCMKGRVIRCEHDLDYDERRFDEVDASEILDFMACHRIPQE